VNDVEALRRLDDHWRARHRPQRRGWFSRPAGTPSGGERRSAPPAGVRAHQPTV
jgi:hypothetical protein